MESKANWVKAKYSENQIDNRAMLTTLESVGVFGKYHVFSCDNGTKITTFDDQNVLLDYINSNLGSIFLIKLLLHSNNKFSYNIKIGDEMETVFTIGKALVAIEGTDEEPRTIIYSHNDGLIVVE